MTCISQESRTFWAIWPHILQKNQGNFSLPKAPLFLWLRWLFSCHIPHHGESRTFTELKDPYFKFQGQFWILSPFQGNSTNHPILIYQGKFCSKTPLILKIKDIFCLWKFWGQCLKNAPNWNHHAFQKSMESEHTRLQAPSSCFTLSMSINSTTELKEFWSEPVV